MSKQYPLEQLYAKYASRLWSGVPEMFYDRVYADETLGHFFKDREKAYMREHLESLLHHLVGGPKLYEGRDLLEAHKNLDIDSNDFDLLIDHMRGAFIDVGIEDDDADLIITRIKEEEPKIVKT